MRASAGLFEGGGRGGRAVLAVLLAWVLLALAAPSAFAVPRVPQPAPVIYAEDFQNVPGPSPVLRLNAYVGATGQTYTADPAWLSACNGWVAAYGQDPTAAAPAADCGAQLYWNNVQRGSYALGSFAGAANPADNYAISAWTQPTSPGAGKVEFQTVTNVPFSANSRFVTFSVDVAAANCTIAAHPRLQFSLLNEAGVATPVGSEVDACTSSTTVNPPAIGNSQGQIFRVGTYTSNGALLFTGTSLGVRMVNNEGSFFGNDHAFDNIRILDVTPTLDKMFSPDTVNAGARSTLTFTITNTNELAAKSGWSFTDNLPAGLVVADPASASTTCPAGSVNASTGGSSIAAIGNLDAGQMYCEISVAVTSPRAGTYTNCAANVTTVGLNAPGCSSVRFVAADVEIVKSARPVPVVPGTELTYTLRVTNNGPDAATNVRVVDGLPAGLSFVSASPECGETGGTVTCVLPSLAVGASREFAITARVASSLEACPENTATVTSDVTDLNPDNNSATACPPIRGRADLSLTKTPSRTEVPTGGGQVIYTLVVSNAGPSDVTRVTVTDPVPAGLTLVAAESSQGSCAIAGGMLACDVGRLVAGGSAQILMTANTWGTPGAITNTASVRGDQEDPDPDNNVASAVVMVPAAALGTPDPLPPVPSGGPAQPVLPQPVPPAFDLVVTKTAGDRTVYVGDAVRYRIVVANRGPAAAPNVTMTDTFNAPGRGVSARPSQGTCATQLPVTCSLGTIPAGGRATVTVAVEPQQSGRRQRNAASATGAGPEIKPDDNLDAATIRVRKVRLRLTKVADKAAVSAGRRITFTIRVSNPTRGVARRVRVCDRLPAGLLYVNSKAKARLRNGSYCWMVKRLGARRHRQYRITVRALRSFAGTTINRATARSADARTRRASRAVRILPRPAACPVATSARAFAHASCAAPL